MISIDPRHFEAIWLACMDPDPIDLNWVDEHHVGRAHNAIKRAQRNGKTVGLRNVIRRNEFLAACLEHTHGATVEHLIIGYGFQYRNGTDIDRIRHVGGKERSVAIPPDVHEDIERHYRHRTDADVLIFHNDPRTGAEAEWLYTLKAILNDLPVPSMADRAVLQATALDAIGILRTLLGQGRIRFYLGESDLVREFRLPPLLPFLNIATATGRY